MLHLKYGRLAEVDEDARGGRCVIDAEDIYMLASLALGAAAAEHTHRFLQDEITPGSEKNRRT
ncbi:unnamed protein product [Tuber aestivum]|uniref:Uncharacterized protein n=1 Tax=Tuber aestivum TaxID=59557 RepID=A0A292PU74_9PEZI|nr:unnamed protein product [Tuber aestivum]